MSRSVGEYVHPQPRVYMDAWPLYVNDDGAVSCGRCGEDAFDWMPAARRRTVLELLSALAVHASGKHGGVLIKRGRRTAMKLSDWPVETASDGDGTGKWCVYPAEWSRTGANPCYTQLFGDTPAEISQSTVEHARHVHGEELER